MYKSLLSFGRRSMYWLSDYLKGGTVRTFYYRIKKIDNLDYNDEQLSKYQLTAFSNLKNAVCDHVAFYNDMIDKDLDEFPIINKNTIRSSQNDFMSDNYNRNKLFKMSTSGSTGTPFICYQNLEKKRCVNAEIIYYSEKAGYRLGNNLSYIRTIVKQIKKSKFKQFVQNQMLINCAKLSDDGILDILDAVVNYSRNEPVTLLGYGSTFTALKDYIKAHNLKHHIGNVTGIISRSDMLYDETRSVMESYFGCKMVSRYSNEENGVLGQDELVNNEFFINEASYIIEICDDAGNKVPDGNLGHIVVTDLFNYAMPMIRYDTGDIGSIKQVTINRNGKIINRRVLYNFSGRSVDVIFNTTGEAISPHLITNNLWNFPDISQFQLIQKGEKDYHLLLNVPENYNRIEELDCVLHSLLGSDAHLDIKKVSEIPVLSSGKRRYIVNEWKSRQSSANK